MEINSFKFIIIILIIINGYLTIKINTIQKFFANKSKTNNLKIIHNLYKEFLQLYIENREKFYSKGREYIMKKRGSEFNESNLVTFQDKLNYLLIHESPENKTNIVDKILLRNYSIKILGKDICVPILKIYNNVDEINLEELPEKFILKCNHGSGMNIFCTDKSKFNLIEAKNLLKEWMNINYGLTKFEYQYLNVQKKVFAEKFLEEEITNYKFSCFNGEPKYIRVKGKIKGINVYNIYTINWTLTNFELYYSYYKRAEENQFKKPKNLKKMTHYARLLSSNFCYCRVDFYEIKGIIYLGELTFSPFNTQAKYKNKETDIYFGNLLNISKFK